MYLLKSGFLIFFPEEEPSMDTLIELSVVSLSEGVLLFVFLSPFFVYYFLPFPFLSVVFSSYSTIVSSSLFPSGSSSDYSSSIFIWMASEKSPIECINEGTNYSKLAESMK